MRNLMNRARIVAEAKAASLAEEIVRTCPAWWGDDDLASRGLKTDPERAGLLEDCLEEALRERGWTMLWSVDGLEFRNESS